MNFAYLNLQNLCVYLSKVANGVVYLMNLLQALNLFIEHKVRQSCWNCQEEKTVNRTKILLC